MIYHHLADPLDDDQRLRLDALLGDPAAERVVAERRRETAIAGGFEVG